MTERHTAAPATDQTINQHPGTEPEKKSGLDLSPIQVMGGALAAMTAAGLGSRFSVEGTVVGAALASVIAAVAGALYTASLRRTREAVRGVLGGRRAIPGQGAPTPTGSTAVAPESLSSPTGLAGPSAKTSRRRNLVLSSVVGAIAIFALAAGALTTYEALAGRALSGGNGTTISQVQKEGRDDRPTDDKAPAASESAEPSESADPTATAEPSDTPQAESAPTTEPSAESTVEPSAEPSATSEPEPSATATQPSVAPSGPGQTPR